MSDFNSCEFGAITPELLARSLLSGIDSLNSCGIRTTVSTSIANQQTLYMCSTPTDLFELFRRALIIAPDGKVAIRVLETTSVDGDKLSTCQPCTDAYTLYELLGSLFVQDGNGDVYLNIINITT